MKSRKILKAFDAKKYWKPHFPEDPEDFRWGHHVKSLSLSDIKKLDSNKDIVIVGYPDDRGILRNQGRPGAKLGPQHIRQHFYKFVLPKNFSYQLWDLGDLITKTYSLEKAHQNAETLMEELHKKGIRSISLGGGHDWAYPDHSFFMKEDNFGLVNFDAHLDMRPEPKEKNRRENSGTAYRLLLEKRERQASLSVLGLQEHCNSPQHLDWAQKQKNVDCIFLETLSSNFEKQFEELYSAIPKKKNLSLSLCLDVFSQKEAPGVSAPQVRGLHSEAVFKCLEKIAKETRHFGIYELSPTHDVEEQTARLAAKALDIFLRGL